MTPLQRSTVQTLQAEGFQIVENCTDIVRLTKGADKRLVRADGSQMRANHIERGGK
ncbi:hypothetical protein LS633_00370 [Pseudomonas sp. NIBR-H-19]|uniref:hypothetical protein n=1 Tax=Pseudomonas sp. NIBR-H-19 TaxID=2901380 RepID=UPI001E309824|nr:hypothetical protein [Pseudomonas sp. NIBR-H-19]UHC82268.1 hypothetical protein LS633_00035 [Pseudomonas sp. NIBR-H-19]UHC82334.1 hypothetical protein LS633_00370 [Pseudomonas sp. NIBR-H-19]